ncbi:MAG: hypothetical protein SOW56_07710, partial [Bacteroidaceae bacterium]|nr:hypothetical protein [Bacteroidaceae bacterium]
IYASREIDKIGTISMASTHTSMRHAILITAYTDFVQLISLVEMFDYLFDIYIHIDKKAKISRDIQKISN